MIAEIETVAKEIARLANKPKYPFDAPAQLELARVALKHAKDLTHLREIIGEISEQWDHCPDGKELCDALSVSKSTPTFTVRSKCPLGRCDGSGWETVYSLFSDIRGPNGTAYTEKRPLTADQVKSLEKQIDWKSQRIYAGARPCGCHILGFERGKGAA